MGAMKVFRVKKCWQLYKKKTTTNKQTKKEKTCQRKR